MAAYTFYTKKYFDKLPIMLGKVTAHLAHSRSLSEQRVLTTLRKNIIAEINELRWMLEEGGWIDFTEQKNINLKTLVEHELN
jgi:hypothetical protein